MQEWLGGTAALPLPPLLRGGGEGNAILERITPGGARGLACPGLPSATPAGFLRGREECTRTIEPARARAAETLTLERALSDLANQAYGLTGMALKLALCFSWVTFPIAIAVLGIFKEMARLCQPCTGLGAAFHGPGFTAAGTVGQ